MSFYGDLDNWAYTLTYSGEALTLEKVNWEYSDTTWVAWSKENTVNGVKIIPQQEVRISGKWNTKPPQAPQDLVGYINDNTFLGSPAKTLLFTGMDISYDGSAQDFKWNINMSFIRKKQTWNYFYNDKQNKFVKVRNASDTTPPYSDVSFSDLNPSNW